jgi:hypothetical protein
MRLAVTTEARAEMTEHVAALKQTEMDLFTTVLIVDLPQGGVLVSY